MTVFQEVASFFTWKGGKVSYPQGEGCDLIVDIPGEPKLRVHVPLGWDETDSEFKVMPPSDKNVDDSVICLVIPEKEIVIIHQAALSEDGTVDKRETSLWSIKEHGVDYLLKRDARIYKKTTDES